MPASYDVRIYISRAPVDMTREWLASLANYAGSADNWGECSEPHTTGIEDLCVLVCSNIAVYNLW